MGWHFEPRNTFFSSFLSFKKTIAAEHFGLIFGLIINQQNTVVPRMSIANKHLKLTLLCRDSKSKEECFRDT